jgi:uncharacterized protein
MSGSRIVIFAKAPQPGFAKTRLIPALGADGAAALARRMLDATLQHACAARVGSVELCATPALSDPAWRGIPIPKEIEISAQGDGDLGVRLARAAARALQRGPSVLLIGTDCPDLDGGTLVDAARMLQEVEAVMHPVDDGGYALLGLRRFDARVFEDIAWSTGSVARTTLARLAELQWSVHLGRVLHDIDEPADLEHLPSTWASSARGAAMPEVELRNTERVGTPEELEYGSD